MRDYSVILSTLIQIREAFLGHHVVKLRRISERALSTGILHNDRGLAELAVIAYALHKMTTKTHIIEHPSYPALRVKLDEEIGHAVKALQTNSWHIFKTELDHVIIAIQQVDTELGHHWTGFYQKGKIKLASEAYSTGMSLSQAGWLLDVDKKAVQDYIGSTRLFDREHVEKDITQRIAEFEQKTGRPRP